MNLTLLHPRIHIRILDHPSDRLVAFAAAVAAVAAVVVVVVVVAALAVSIVRPLLASA